MPERNITHRGPPAGFRTDTYDSDGRAIPWWGLASSAATPVVLVGGWMLAASLQPHAYDPIRQSVSTLAAIGEPDRWVMTLVFVLVAICYLVTALALRPAARAGRIVMAAGGVAGIMVAVSPESTTGRLSLAHDVWATIGLTLLALWPLAARRAGSSAPRPLRPAATIGAVAAMAVLLIWFFAEVVAGGAQIGLAERVVGVAQASWPLLVVMSCRIAVQPAWQVVQRSDQGPGG